MLFSHSHGSDEACRLWLLLLLTIRGSCCEPRSRVLTARGSALSPRLFPALLLKTSSYPYLKLCGGPSLQTTALRTSPVPAPATALISVTIGLQKLKIHMARSLMGCGTPGTVAATSAHWSRWSRT